MSAPLQPSSSSAANPYASAKSVYIRGLPDKPPREEIRRALYLYCSQFGPVLEVHYPRTRKLYGQAYVTFADLSTANACRRVMMSEEHRTFYGRRVDVFLTERPSFLVDPSERRRRDARRAAEAAVAAAASTKQRVAATKRPREEESEW